MEGLVFFVLSSALTLQRNWLLLRFRQESHRKLACSSDDDCQSLFYSKLPRDSNGEGFPWTKTVDSDTVKRLTTVHKEYRRLDMNLYKVIVENLPICCVDVICQRASDTKILLFYRRDSPAASIWWWPGGRMYRGETFFATAKRKILEETGSVYQETEIVPIGVNQVWNTFFPDSNWDKDRDPSKMGTHTVNTIAVCRLNDERGQLHKNRLENMKTEDWAVEASKWVSVNELLEPGKYDKYVRLNVESCLSKDLLVVS